MSNSNKVLSEESTRDYFNPAVCEVCGGPAPEGRPRQYGDESYHFVCRRRCDDADPLIEYGVEDEDASTDEQGVSTEEDADLEVEVVLTVALGPSGEWQLTGARVL